MSEDEDQDKELADIRSRPSTSAVSGQTPPPETKTVSPRINEEVVVLDAEAVYAEYLMTLVERWPMEPSEFVKQCTLAWTHLCHPETIREMQVAAESEVTADEEVGAMQVATEMEVTKDEEVRAIEVAMETKVTANEEAGANPAAPEETTAAVGAAAA